MDWSKITHQQVWEEEWKEICTTNDGTLNLDQIQRELADYAFMLDQVPKVYEEVSGLSKPNTYAIAVISKFENKREETFKMWIKDFIENNEDMHLIHKVSDEITDNEYAKGIEWVFNELRKYFDIQ